jgi:pimeloyl-ACP methyl ester carboxylesterase
MSIGSVDFVLPRPGGATGSSKPPIPGPTEAAFTETFGTLLPPARYLNTANGKAAYYEFLPSSSSSSSPGKISHTPDRVVFIHGVQTPALGMYPLAHALKASFPHAHFVLVDLWGHGLSETPVVPHDMSLFHQLLDALLDHLEWPSAHLIGFSFGGALTVGYVASRSSRVQSFALVAPAGLRQSSNFTAEERGHLRGGDEAAARKWVLELLEGGALVVPADWKERVVRGEAVAEAVRQWQMVKHPGHAASVVAVFRDGGVLDNDALFVKAARTGIPSLAVLGGLDDLCSEQQLNELGFANVAVVPQVGHGVVRDRAPEVAAFINNFWMKLSTENSN